MPDISFGDLMSYGALGFFAAFCAWGTCRIVPWVGNEMLLPLRDAFKQFLSDLSTEQKTVVGTVQMQAKLLDRQTMLLETVDARLAEIHEELKAEREERALQHAELVSKIETNVCSNFVPVPRKDDD